MTIKKYWIPNDLLDKNKPSLDDIKLIESLNRMDSGKREFIKVLKLSELKKEIEELQNPYPEDIFPIPTKQEWKKFHKILEEKNLTQDKFFGYFGRLVWNNCKERLLKELLG